MQEIEALPVGSWQVWQVEKGGVIRVWAEVPYVPTRQYERRDSQPYRYLAIRVRRQQGKLFEDGTMVRHFAVVSNRWGHGRASPLRVAARQGRYSPTIYCNCSKK